MSSAPCTCAFEARTCAASRSPRRGPSPWGSPARPVGGEPRGVTWSVANVYLGTSEFAATVLRRLAASPHRPALCLTPPDRPRGRGQRLASPPAAEAARELGIEVLQVASVNEPAAVDTIRSAAPELGAV